MPHRNLARRFEPRYGATQPMVDMEAKWVERELEDQLVFPINELRKNLSDIQAKVASAEQRLEATLGRLPDRERLALKYMLARDVFHMAALYETFLRYSPLVQGATGTVNETPEEVDQQGEPRPVLIFQQSLFS
jgi:hypothetical protein